MYESHLDDHSTNRLLSNHGQSVKGFWLVATNLVSHSDTSSVGVLFQDRNCFHSSIDARRRAVCAGWLSATCVGRASCLAQSKTFE